MKNKNDFINEIIKGFPSSFKGLNIETEKEKYMIALEEDLDFDKLYTLFIKDWQYRTAPAPAYFEKFFPQCRKVLSLRLINMPSERRSALIKIANWCNSPEYEECLYKGTKAPPNIRELFRKYRFETSEIDLARISGQIGEE